MAPVAIVVVEFSAFSLLRVEAEFSIGLAPLDIAGRESHREYYHGDTEARRKPIRGNH
jgi:hypothetical protein